MVDSILQLSSSVLHDVIKLVIVIKIEIKIRLFFVAASIYGFSFSKASQACRCAPFDIDNQCSGKMLPSRDVTCFFDYRLLTHMCPSSGRLFEIVTE